MDNKMTAEQALEKLLRANESEYTSVRHFVEHWLGGEGKVLEMIEVAESHKDRLVFLRFGIANIRQALHRENRRGAINDTLWVLQNVSPNLTLFDYMDFLLDETEHAALSAPMVPDIASMIDGFDDTEFVRRHGNSIRQCLAVVNDMDLQELRDLVVGYWGVANKLLAASHEPVADTQQVIADPSPADDMETQLAAKDWVIGNMQLKDSEQEAEIADLRAEVEALKAKLAEWAGEAYDDVGNWAAYAPQYFHDKHGLSDDLDKWAARKSSSGIDAARLREGDE